MWEKFTLGTLLFEKWLHWVLVSSVFLQWNVLEFNTKLLAVHFRKDQTLQENISGYIELYNLFCSFHEGTVLGPSLLTQNSEAIFPLGKVCTKIKEALNFPQNIREWKLWAQAQVQVTSSVLSVKLAPLANATCKVICLNSISLWAKAR